jgi:hypothetical protein
MMFTRRAAILAVFACAIWGLGVSATEETAGGPKADGGGAGPFGHDVAPS